MMKPGHIFKINDDEFLILSNSYGRIVYRKFGFPISKLINENRRDFEFKIEQKEYEKIEGRLILENRELRNFFNNWSSFRNKNSLYKIISTAEEMVVFQEMNFPTSKLYQTSHSKFKELTENGKIKKRIRKNVEVGDVFILARTNFTYEVLSIDRNAMVIKRFFKNEWKICENYGFYQFCKDVNDGKFILI